MRMVHELPGIMFSYASEQLLDALSASGYDELRVARLEWGLLPVLDRYNRSPRTLHKLMGGSPDFFVEVVSLVYRSEEEEQVQLTEAEEARAHLRADRKLWRPTLIGPRSSDRLGGACERRRHA